MAVYIINKSDFHLHIPEHCGIYFLVPLEERPPLPPLPPRPPLALPMVFSKPWPLVFVCAARGGAAFPGFAGLSSGASTSPGNK